MRSFFKVLFWLFAALYAFALFVAGASLFGWFGAQPDALAGVYLVVLAFPWLLLADGIPDAAGTWVLALLPLLNLALIGVIAAWLGKRARQATPEEP